MLHPSPDQTLRLNPSADGLPAQVGRNAHAARVDFLARSLRRERNSAISTRPKENSIPTPGASADPILLGTRLPHHWHSEKPTAGLSLQWNFPSHHPLFELPETEIVRALFQRAWQGLRLSGATREQVARQMGALAGACGLVRLGRLLELLATIAITPAAEARPLAEAELGFVLRFLI